MTLYRIGAELAAHRLLIEAAEARQAGGGAGGAQGALRRAQQHPLGQAAGVARHPCRLWVRRSQDARQAVPRRPAGAGRHPALRPHGTGNYNPETAKVYTDLGLFTANPDIVADVSEIFNYLTGYSNQKEFRHLLVAPVQLRTRLTELITREAEHARAGRPARIIIKVNAVTDDQMIRVLYRASQAGVPIDLIVRGICSLRPGIPGVSDNIRVRSIVGRFLEHSRIYWFQNGGSEEMYIGSADLMERNLDRRVETLVPVRDAGNPRSISGRRAERLSAGHRARKQSEVEPTTWFDCICLRARCRADTC